MFIVEYHEGLPEIFLSNGSYILQIVQIVKCITKL